ncbi:Nn.00g049280.m01.CDS01 [Neocucurbitaria sp. VM-36]
MTSGSNKPHQQPKTTTISRRLRNRVDQNLSVQAPEIPQPRGVRSRRAATLPAPRHNLLDYQTPESHPSSLAWDAPDILENIPPDNTSTLTSAEETRPSGLHLSQHLDFPPYEYTQVSQAELAPNTDVRAIPNYQPQPPSRLSFPPSPLPSVSGSHDFDLRLSTDPEQPHDPFLDLQDMSSLGFMMPPSQQYGMNHYGSPPSSYSPSYAPQQSYVDPRASTAGPYGSSYASSPALPNERRPDEHAILPPYQTQAQSLPRSPYQQQQPLSSMRGGAAPLTSATHTYTYPAQQHSIPSQPLGNNPAGYSP